MLVYKINVMKTLKEAGYSSYFMEKNKVFGSADLQKMRKGIVVGINSLGRLCSILHCQPGDLIEWRPDSPAQDDGQGNR